MEQPKKRKRVKRWVAWFAHPETYYTKAEMFADFAKRGDSPMYGKIARR